MKNAQTFDPKRMLKALCLLVLAFVPVNMLFSPIYDSLSVEERGAAWTVTWSAFIFILTSMLLFSMALPYLRSRIEKIFISGGVIFFLYAFIFTICMASNLLYPIIGLISVLGSTLTAILFYVAVRENIISHKVVFYFLASASIFVAVPLLIVQIDTERFARLSEEFGAVNILYGYENPRALGWASTICLSLLAGYLSTQPKERKINPIFLLLTIISSTVLFWSGSRGGVIAFALSISFVFSLSQTKNYTGLWSILLCIAAGGVISLLLYLPAGSYVIFARISQNLGQENIASMSSGRTELWHTTYSYILERPLTGYGYLPHKNLVGFNHGSAHNIILDAWLWFGLIIGSLFILLGMMLWLKAFVFFRKINDQYISALFCVVTTLFAYSLVSGPYARTFPLLLFAISCGTILGLRSSKSN